MKNQWYSEEKTYHKSTDRQPLCSRMLRWLIEDHIHNQPSVSVFYKNIVKKSISFSTPLKPLKKCLAFHFSCLNVNLNCSSHSLWANNYWIQSRSGIIRSSCALMNTIHDLFPVAFSSVYSATRSNSATIKDHLWKYNVNP